MLGSSSKALRQVCRASSVAPVVSRLPVVRCHAHQSQHSVRRRDVGVLLAGAGVALSQAAWPSTARADALVEDLPVPSSLTEAVEELTQAAPSGPVDMPAEVPSRFLFQDDEYEYYPPPGFEFFEIPVQRRERGPAPERSPIRSRFTAGDGGEASVSVVARGAQGLTFRLLQVSDVTDFGSIEDTAKLLLPRGSVLLASSSEVIQLAPRETPLGPVEIPPKTYFYYEYLTSRGEHILMAAAATKGTVYVCGGAAPQDQWVRYAEVLRTAVQSFRLRDKFAA